MLPEPFWVTHLMPYPNICLSKLASRKSGTKET